MNEYGGLIHEDPSLLAAMSAAVDFVNKRGLRNPSNGVDRVRELEQAQGNTGQRTIPYRKPPGPHSHEELESDNTPRKGELIMATAGGHGSPRNKPGRRNQLGKRWTEEDILKAVYGTKPSQVSKAHDFHTAFRRGALQRALAIQRKARIAGKMLRLKRPPKQIRRLPNAYRWR